MRKTLTILNLLVLLCGFSLVPHEELCAQAFNWTTLGTGSSNGTNGIVNAVAVFNGKIIVGGSFTQAGGVTVNNIAQWDEETGWTPLNNGLNGTVYALTVWNNQLYVGGSFTSIVGGTTASRIARWNGISWSPVGIPPGVNNDVYAFTTYNSNLIVAGRFNVAGNTTANRIVKLTPFGNWVTLGSGSNNGVNDEVYALTVLSPISGDLLIVGGKFTRAVAGDTLNYIARWDEGSWGPLSRGMDERVFALTVHDSILYAGGWFLNASGVSAKYIARWNGVNWSSLPKEVDDRVSSLVSYRGELVAAGGFKFADTLYVDRIAKWNGSNWARLVTGVNNKVNALCVNDTDLYAGGNFTTAGGKVSRYIARWGIQPTRTISGTVRYIDNNMTVNRGKVRAIRLDVNTREVINVDTTSLTNGGLYTLPKVLIDTLFIVVVPNDELEDNFVPTYHDSTIDWKRAVKVYPLGNLNNINVFVLRGVPPGPISPTELWIGGHVYLNYLPPKNFGLPYKSDAIVYAKKDGLFRRFAISNTSELYRLTPLTPGTYDLVVHRLGFTSAERTVVLGSTSIDTIDFYLDTLNPIGIKNVNLRVPENFALYQNFPNPFNPVTVIEFSILNRSYVTMRLFNILGQEVLTLVNEVMEPGDYELTFNATNLPSGVYFYKLIAEGFSETKKMILLK